ncbi:phospholipase D-like domain-containing protein [Salipaludibacillus sp. CF4.18]|uniref:phospholipase D-like domain-containing protein n=1 Tax=Salipaludibacillus sp. CF4.18 TaxID=3373081 RepID=UPI003EE4F55D
MRSKKKDISAPFLKRKKNVFWLCILLLVFIYSGSLLYGQLKELPEGLSFESTNNQSEVYFLRDITYTKNNKRLKNQEIIEEIEQLVDRTEEFILVDMFLFNDQYPEIIHTPELAKNFTKKLIDKKTKSPHISITVLTDEINTLYGSRPSPELEKLKVADIQVLTADTAKLRDSNPLYTSGYRAFLQWAGTPEGGWIPIPFQHGNSEVKVTARSYLEAFKLTANHRKIVMNEKEAIITSANLHGPSAHHSNIAFHVKGDVLKDIAKTEKEVISFAGGDGSFIQPITIIQGLSHNNHPLSVSVLSEQKIKTNILEECRRAGKQTTLWLAAFNLSDRDIINGLLHASEKGARVNIILDKNKESYGKEKNGIPNQPVAHELAEKSNENLNLKWYNANGEQFHTKLFFSVDKDRSTAIGGSANFTKKNLEDGVYEMDLKITGSPKEAVLEDIETYLKTLWENDEIDFTEEYSESKEEASSFRYWLYRLQEASGISTF